MLRPQIAGMIPRIRMTGRDPRDEPTEPGARLPPPRLAPPRLAHEVRVRLADGRVLERARTWPRGGIQAPLDAEDRRIKFEAGSSSRPDQVRGRIKFEDCVAPVLGADAAAALRASLGRLDRLAGMAEVTAALASAGTGALSSVAE